ncbi:AAA family ATPase [Nitrosomonas communis]|uniref:Predicted ATP-dependent endonuclease of the OLD family, contains P-loop ATPase and TOPRIM domains n=1 Tax=Nitrosomonas communis TaxID=44574 RepID=A0A1I4PRK1_9PROT|nr:AAA family ATPase [Nitrosomonas communis]SFM30359.1 Predicted ATP-dependent endonuclease of the OLD family, contains P-loop ATPase and TOPRIM domains [Nitrosomonas communis]
MKIESMRIENFRSFKDEKINFNDYSCFVGPNGAGKSTVLAALNVFFRQYKDSKTDLSKLSVEDFHHKNVSQPIKITVTFNSLSDEAEGDLADYVRQGQLVISSIATYDSITERAEVKQYGSRLGMDDFRIYFDEHKKTGTSSTKLKDIYNQLRKSYTDLPEVKTKEGMAEALRKYEAEHPDKCELIPSEDQFYGASKGANRLAPHVQWVFVPAAKDIIEESQETKNSALGQLLARTIRSKVNFDEKVATLRKDIRSEYQSILDAEQSVLDSLSVSLELKLKNWAHPNATVKVLWKHDPEKSVKLEEPWAYIRIGERGFEGELARFGHGMQRSYMLTLLQELATIEDVNAPTLIMGIEEPELYQHPPQAKYLADILHDLSMHGSQIFICSHSPFFIPGDDFETIRLIRDIGTPGTSSVAQIKYSDLANKLKPTGKTLLKESGMLAKLYPSLNPIVNEMFFCKVLVLTEGIEDVAYLTAYLSLSGIMSEFRRHGCHIVPVGGKSELIKPLAMAKLLNIPLFVIFDADTDIKNGSEAQKHEKDNKNILALMGYEEKCYWPDDTIWKHDLVVWKTDLGKIVADEIGQGWKDHYDNACAAYGNAPKLNKNPLAISRALESSWKSNQRSTSLEKVVSNIVNYASNQSPSNNSSLASTSNSLLVTN